MDGAQDRARSLRDDLAYHEHRYHVLESPTISTRRYQEMRAELAELERGQTVPVTPDSASLRVASPRREALMRAMHGRAWSDPPQIRTPQELRAYHDAIHATDGRTPVCVGSGAITGAEVALTYVEGCLRSAVLRGDGHEGEDVTANLRTIGSVPLKLRPPGTRTDTRVSKIVQQVMGPSTATPVPPFATEMVVRGTVSMRSLDLVALDRRRIDAGEPPYMSPAAAILASIRTLDSRVTASRRLHFFAQDTAELMPDVNTHWQLLGSLKSWGFAVTPLTWRCEGFEEILAFVNALQGEKPNFHYPLQGGLLTMDRFGILQSADPPPRTVRLAFVTMGQRAIVKSVYRAVGRSGAVLPVALLSPGEGETQVPDGAPIPAVNGSSFVALAEGTPVRILAGGAAPLIELDGTVPQAESEVAAACPSCRAPLRKPADQPVSYCDNLACRGRNRSRLLHLTGQRGLELRSFTARVAEALFPDRPFTLADLFSLDPSAVEQVAPGTGETFRAEIDAARGLPLWRVLYLSSIPDVSERAARALAAALLDFDGLAQLARTGATRDFEGVPPEALDGLMVWLAGPGPADLDALRTAGVTIVSDDDVFSAPFLGQHVALAGRFESGSPDQAVDDIERRGGTIEPRVSRRTDLLIAGREADAELVAAETYNIPVVHEAGFSGVVRLLG